ncbi:MAG: PAS domain-containing protein, partial [Kiritimatiellae bacterium]|nr:PAS domain-containing protein [Kiritimatiellia bacterium]
MNRLILWVIGGEMHELILICYLEATAILIIVFVTSYFFSRMREEKHSAKKFLDENVGLKGEATGLKEEKDKLRLKYDWYKTLFNNVTDMVLLHGLNDDGSPGTFIDVNHVACKCLEYTREQLLAMTPFDIEDEESSVSSAGYSGSKASGLPGDYAKKTQRKLVTMSLRNMMKQVIEKKHCRFEQVYKTRTGERISVEVDAQVLEHFSKPIIVHTARDMAALKKGQVALLESEQRLQNFFDYSPFGLAMYSADRKLVKVNRPCLRMFGIPDHAAFSGFSLFDNTFVPKSAKKGLEKGETVRYEAVINFDEAAHQGRFVTTRRGKGYLDILINSMGHDRGFSH